MTNPSHAPAPSRPFPAMALLFLAIAFGGFVYAGLGYMGYLAAQIPQDWDQVAGQVVESSVKEIPATAEGQVETYLATVRYRYEVDGTFHLGSRLSQQQSPRTLRGVAETEIEAYGQGTNVTVHVNPSDPEDAVLQKSDTIGPMQAISAGLAIGITCLAIFVISFRRRGKEEALSVSA